MKTGILTPEQNPAPGGSREAKCVSAVVDETASAPGPGRIAEERRLYHRDRRDKGTMKRGRPPYIVAITIRMTTPLTNSCNHTSAAREHKKPRNQGTRPGGRGGDMAK